MSSNSWPADFAPGSRWRGWARLILGWAAIIGLVAFALARVDWSRASAPRLRWSWLLAALALQSLYQLAYVWLWQRVTVAHHTAVPFWRTLSLWGLSLAGKYTPVPGGMYALRTWAYATRAQASIAPVALSCYEEGWLSSYSGILVAIAAAALADLPWLRARVELIAIALVLCAAPIAFPKAVGRTVRRIFGRRWPTITQNLPEPLGARKLALFLAGYCCGWLLLGTVLTALGHALDGTQHLSWGSATASYAGAGVLGIVAVFVPSGLGVRDAALAASLAMWMGATAATWLSVAARVVALTSEAIFMIFGWSIESRGLRARRAGGVATSHPVERVVNEGLCVGCGMCAGSSAQATIHLQFSPQHDQFVPVVEENRRVAGIDPGLVCPGAGVDMPSLSMQVYGRLPEDPTLGIYERLRVCYASDEPVRRRAASGGVVPAVLAHLFDADAIDAAYCLVTDSGPYDMRARILRSPEDIGRIHGSVYQPFDFGCELRTLLDGNERFAFVGLPCQIAGLEEVKRRRPEIAARHILSIGLFCGGVNRFGGIQYYLQRYGVALSDVLRIEYRVGDWPGRIHVRLRDGSEREILRIQGNSRMRILRYMAAFQGYWMLKRCRICPDQIADFADIALGDPHLPEYRRRGGAGYSLVITRSRRGEQVIRQLVARGSLIEEPCDRAQVIASQGYTLDNRRHAMAYVRVARWLGEATPLLNVYPQLTRCGFRHYKYALVDLLKIKLRRVRWLKPLYVPIQMFEYVFITLYPSLIVRRLKRLVTNKGN